MQFEEEEVRGGRKNSTLTFETAERHAIEEEDDHTRNLDVAPESFLSFFLSRMCT